MAAEIMSETTCLQLQSALTVEKGSKTGLARGFLDNEDGKRFQIDNAIKAYGRGPLLPTMQSYDRPSRITLIMRDSAMKNFS